MYLDMQEGLEFRIEQSWLFQNLSRHSNNRTALQEDIKLKIGHLKNISTVICNIQSEKEWSFHDSLSFAKSVITTIGYGVYAPTTTASKIICIVYAMLGVPLFLHFLGYITGGMEYIKDSVINSKVLKQKDVATLTIVVVAIIVLGAMLINGTMTHVLQQQSDGQDLSKFNERTQAILNSSISVGSESQWGYFVCVYYVFESITTLGFGDLYVHGAGGGEAIVKDILTLLFVSILIAMFAFLFGLLQDEIENYTLKKITSKKGRLNEAVQRIIQREREAKEAKKITSEPNKRYSLEIKALKKTDEAIRLQDASGTEA